MRLALVQTNPLVGGVRKNLEALTQTVRSHAAQADLFVFPELALVGYPPRDLLAEPALAEEEARALEAVARLSQETGVAILVGHTERRQGDGAPYYNAASLFDGGQVVARVRKQRLPSYDIFEEERFFEPWTGSQVPVEFRGLKLGIFICEDAWTEFSAFGRDDERRHSRASAPTLQGADLLVNISASPYTMGKRPRREAVFADHARACAAPLVFCGSTGAQDGILFDGASFAMDASGTLRSQAKIFAEDVLLLELTSDGAWAAGSPPARPHACWDELRAGIVCGIRDYIRKSGFSSVVLGLSGGIDSALVAALAAEALGPSNVLGVSLPSRITSDESRDDARVLASKLGIAFREISIAEAVAAHVKALALAEKGLPFENLQSRNRGVLLMTISNLEGRLLLSTGNKSEMAVGYSTLYGDLCGALAPIGDLYKTEVYGLSHWMQREKETIPLSTLLKAPTAELAPGQRDSDSLPHYAVLDTALEDMLENQSRRLYSWQSFLEPAFKEPAALVRKVRSMEFKRYQAPPILKVHARAFGNGWKLPIAKEISP